MNVLKVDTYDGTPVTRLFIGCARETADIRRWIRTTGLRVTTLTQTFHPTRTVEEEQAAQALLRRYVMEGHDHG